MSSKPGMPRLSRPLGLLLVMAGVAAGFALILIIGFSLDHGSGAGRGPALDKNGFPVPLTAAATPEPAVQPGDTRLDMIAQGLLPGPAFKAYSAVILPLGAVVLVGALGLALRARLRRQARRNAERAPEADPNGPLMGPEQVRERIESLALAIGAPPDKLPTYGRPRDFGEPHIEIDQAYHWIVTERGQEITRRTTRDLDELLYFTFQSVTFSMATNTEVRHRRKGEDFRRQLFQVQLGLLDSLHSAWAARCRAELDEILAANPFVDGQAY